MLYVKSAAPVGHTLAPTSMITRMITLTSQNTIFWWDSCHMFSIAFTLWFISCVMSVTRWVQPTFSRKPQPQCASMYFFFFSKVLKVFLIVKKYHFNCTKNTTFKSKFARMFLLFKKWLAYSMDGFLAETHFLPLLPPSNQPVNQTDTQSAI